MRRNTVKRALAAGRPIIGTWINIADAGTARIMARAGFDYLTLDMEHAACDWEKASVIFGFIAEAGCVPLCRIPENTTENVKRALDAGAWGIVAPMVNTAAQAQVVIDAARYPPQGLRSVGPGSHYLSFGATDASYKELANDEIVVILMTESPEGIRNAREIYSLDGFDAVFIGPADLRAQMRRELPLGRHPTTEEFEAALGVVHAAGAAAKKPVGIHCFSTDECKARVDAGFRIMTVSSDAGFLAAAAASAVTALGIERGSTAAVEEASGKAVVGGLGRY
jgi:4-hydroxy-2-oxoheptanedioate aldolase